MQFTFYFFTTVLNAAAVSAAKEEDLFLSCCWQHNCCMVSPLLTEKELIWQDDQISPQCCVVSPIILPTAPRDARSGLWTVPSTGDELLSFVNDREGVAPFFRKRRDGTGGCWESFNGCLSFFSSGYYESCNMKALQNTWNAYFLSTNHNCVWAMV